MQFSAPAEALRAALASVTAIVEARQVIPVLASVKVVADSIGIVRVSATNLELWVDALVDGAKVEEGGEACIPAAEFAKLVGLAKKQHVEVSADDTGVATLSFGRTSAELKLFPVEDFPKEPDWAALALQDVDGDLLGRALRFCGVTMADSDTLYFLRGVCLRGKDGGADATSTDKHAVHRITLPTLPLVGTAIIPGQHVKIAAAIAEAGGRVLFGLGENWWAIDGHNVRARGSVIDGAFPDVDRLITATDLVATVDRAALMEAIDIASTGAERSAKIVHVVLDISGDEIGVRGFRPGAALRKGVATSIDAETRSGFLAAFNAAYLHDTLRSLDCERVALLEAPAPNGVSVLHIEPVEQAVDAHRRAIISSLRMTAAELAA